MGVYKDRTVSLIEIVLVTENLWYSWFSIISMTVQVHTKNSERIGSDMKCSGPKKFYNSEGDFF